MGVNLTHIPTCHAFCFTLWHPGACSVGSLVETRLEDLYNLFLKVYSRNKPLLPQHLMGVKSIGPDYNWSELNSHNLWHECQLASAGLLQICSYHPVLVLR